MKQTRTGRIWQISSIEIRYCRVREYAQILYGIGSAGLCGCGGASGRKYICTGQSASWKDRDISFLRFKGKEAVDVRFTYDINGILVVDTRVVSTGVVKTHIISQKIPEAELEERVRELEKLKVHPRDLSENQQMMERLEALYQEVSKAKKQVQQMIRTFEEFLDGQNPRQIQGYRRYWRKRSACWNIMIRLRKV